MMYGNDVNPLMMETKIVSETMDANSIFALASLEMT
jgi:hypothetical protein